MIDIYSKHENMDNNVIFYTLICINNHIISCVNCMISTSNYPARIKLYDPTYMMSMADPMAISVETLMIDSGCSFEKAFIEFIHMNL